MIGLRPQLASENMSSPRTLRHTDMAELRAAFFHPNQLFRFRHRTYQNADPAAS
jgi:hypothetical protein